MITMTKAKTKALLKDGNGIAGAARCAGVSYGVMQRIVKGHGLSGSPGRACTDIGLGELRRALRDRTWADAAAFLGCSVTAVRNAAKRRGMRKRDLRSPNDDYPCVV